MIHKTAQPVLHNLICLRCGHGTPECLRCGEGNDHLWWPKSPTRPTRCPHCSSPYWDRPRRAKKPDPEAEALAREARAQEPADCDHKWARRKDGLTCYLCGIVEFGTEIVSQ